MDTVQVDQENLVECRVMVAGDKGVGKSTLVEMFLHGDVSQVSFKERLIISCAKGGSSINDKAYFPKNVACCVLKHENYEVVQTVF